MTGVTQLALAFERTCAVTASGKVFCWGRALGKDPGEGTATPHLLPGASDATAIWIGTWIFPATACIRRRAGTVDCLGKNGEWIPIPNWRGARDIAISEGEFCAILGDDLPVSCRDEPWDGWLGPERNSRHDATADIVNTNGSVAVAAASGRLCIARNSGAIQCIGTETRHRPRPVAGVADVAQITAMDKGTCALKKGGDLVCWGNFKQVVSGGSPPNVLSHFDGLVSFAHARHDVCVIDANAELRCFGGSQDVGAHVFSGVKHGSFGFQHDCIAKTDGRVACWGWNASGALGAPPATTGTLETPVIVRNMRNAVEVGAGNEFTCARGAAGNVSCWGALESPPKSISDAKRLLATSSYACVMRKGGTVACWGRGAAKVFAGTPASREGMYEVPGVSDATDLAISIWHLCLVRKNGRVLCAGDDPARDRGDPVFFEIPEVDDAVSVGVGESHSCALRANGSVWCWGENAAAGAPSATEWTEVPVLGGNAG